MNYNDVIAVTNRHICSRPLTEQIERVCLLHPHAVILREKDMEEEDYLILARQVIDICNSYQVPCILHNFINAARKLNYKAIHLSLSVLREKYNQLDDFKLIGTSVHSTEDALEAVKLGADYLTAGHIYTTDCKKGIPPRGMEFLRNVCQCTDLPVYAIGGIKFNDSQFHEIKNCGAKGGCIMSGAMNL